MVDEVDRVAVIEECLDSLSEVLAYGQGHRWGTNAQRAVAASALKLTGSFRWNDRKEQDRAIDLLGARWERVQAKKVAEINDALARHPAGGTEERGE